MFICLFTISAVSANEMVNETNDILDIDFISINEKMTVEQDDLLNLNDGTFSELASEIDSGGNVSLSKSLYKYDNGSTTIEITKSGIIDGKGAIIDMNGSKGIGVFSVVARNVTFKNITFVNTDGTDIGGSILFKSTECNVINCNFINNTAGRGAAFYSRDMDAISVVNCNFINNSADYGGAIHALAVKLINCKFTNNKAKNGGAIFTKWVRAENCNFERNSARNDDSVGGAIKTDDGFILNSNFINNTANEGGAIYAFSRSLLNISNSNFTNNTALDGGAIYGDDINIFHSNFINNYAIDCGGGIFWHYTSDARLFDCTFVNCSSPYFDDAIFCYSESPYFNIKIENSIFNNNIYIDSDAKVFFNNNSLNNALIFNNGSILSNTSIIVLNNQTINIDYNEIILYASIFDDNGNNIICKNFTFNIYGNDNKIINATLDNRTFKTKVTLKNGSYIINATSIEGNLTNNYIKFGIVNVMTQIYNSSVKIFDIEPTIYGNSLLINFDVENATDVRVVILDSKNNAILNESTINNYVILNNLDAGEYNVIIYNSGDIIHCPSSDEKTFNIFKANSIVSINPIVDLNYGSISIINFTVINRTNVNYILKKEGKEIRRGSTLSSSISFGVLDVGSYTITITNIENNNYESSSDIAFFNVNENTSKININAPDLVKYFRGSERFVVTLTDNSGNPISNKAVFIKLNGAEYTRTTNSDGNASLAINLNAMML